MTNPKPAPRPLVSEPISDAGALPRAVAAIRQKILQACATRDIEALRATIRTAAEANGPITVLVNNAARDDRHAFDTVTPDYWDERFAVNLRHQFFAAQAAYPPLSGGDLIYQPARLGGAAPTREEAARMEAADVAARRAAKGLL